MREIGAFEAKSKLGTLLDWVEAGEEVVITRRGRAVARLVPANAGGGSDRALKAAEGLRRVSRGLSLGGIELKELVREGRP